MVHGRYISRLNSRTRPKRLLLGASRTNVSSLLKCKSKKNLERRAAGGNFADTDGRCCETKHFEPSSDCPRGGGPADSSGVSAHCLGSQDYICVAAVSPARPHASI